MKIRFKLLLFGLVLVIGCVREIATSDDNAPTSTSVQATSNSTSSLSFTPVLSPNSQDDKNEPEMAKRRAFVVNMMKHAWAGYVNCGLGTRGFGPLKCEHVGEFSFAINLYVYSGVYHMHMWDTMPALWIMGLKDEFNQARKWIEQANFEALNYTQDYQEVSTLMGAMLSCYALTGDTFFRDRANEYMTLYLAVTHLNVVGDRFSRHWANIALELPYLSHLTDNEAFRQYANSVELEVGCLFDSLPTLYRKVDQSWGNYMLLNVKKYFQSNQKNQTIIETVYDNIKELQKYEHLNTTVSGLLYLSGTGRDDSVPPEDEDGRVFPSYLCNTGATLAYAAEQMPKVLYNATSWRQLSVDQLASVITYWEMAKNITDTCYLGSKLSTEYMIPNSWHQNRYAIFGVRVSATSVNDTIDVQSLKDELLFKFDQYQILESYFTLWRKTHEKRYRDYAWEMANKIDQYARASTGFTSGYSQNGERINFQYPSIYNNLLYLYLTFTPDTFLPLDKWIFNVAGHPLPICGSGNPAYAEC